MDAERPWVRHDLPWLRSGPLFRVHRSASRELTEFLDRFPYVRVDLDGRQMTSRQSAHAELARAFGFPEYYGGNWDAFDECFGDFVEGHDGELIAVVWDFMDVAAAAAPATTAEVGWELLSSQFSFMPSVASDARSWVWMDAFAIGEGDDFDRPARQ